MIHLRLKWISSKRKNKKKKKNFAILEDMVTKHACPKAKMCTCRDLLDLINFPLDLLD